MITEWTVRRISPITPNGSPCWDILEPGLDGERHVTMTAGTLTNLLAGFSDLVMIELDQIQKEVTEA